MPTTLTPLALSDLSNRRFEAMVHRTLKKLGYPKDGLPEPQAKKARAEAMATLEVHRRCPFCGSLPAVAKPPSPPRSGTSGHVCRDCQKSSERRRQFGCW